MSKKERHLFPGSNTSQGFYSFFQYIIPANEARRIFYIKGGPGTGKSSLMKKISKIFLDNGHTIEFFHCSSDNESLDAIAIKDLGIALIDGTAPHINDPSVPGALDEILNLGVFLNERQLSKEKNSIIETYSAIKDNFNRAYAYINSAKSIHDNWSYYNKKALDVRALNSLNEELKKEIFKSDEIGLGKERHLFATAFTPNGIVSYIDTLYEGFQHIYTLKGEPGTGKTSLLTFLKDEALRRGYSIEIFHDPLIPSRIEHLIIPDLNTAILTSNEINNSESIGKEINMDCLLNTRYINSVQDEIEENKDNFYKLLNIGLKNLSKCKKLHDKLEKYYVDNIDFNGIDILSEKLIERLLVYEKESL
ncbi:hypothetical protein CLLI_18580 [Clostridium liquoris]|uniref:Nephrocystin 3-like N-terminal domain-containing protein n=1 Tax=Clostridium liquoris TaxID=1289519 RepID=A0A2T0B2S3_9CLOT|nr:PRK06851 family protein [Clostridium liquoris]PRR78189.1 hypothetical protein CLLI_18580 [Clostridium liquoris]